MPKHEEATPPALAVYIQAICTYWHKPSRGGTDALPRNRVPEAVSLPPSPSAPKSGDYVLHRATYTAKNGFAAPTSSSLGITPYCPPNTGGVSLSFEDDALHVAYQWDRSQGAPERYSRKVEAFRLSPQQWGRVSYNGRRSGESCWWYEKWVYNIGLFSSPPLSVFVMTDPVKVFTQMAHLF
jgi:hypothetical protein